MKTLQKVLFALVVATSMGSFSSVAMAEKAKYPPAEVIDKISGKVAEVSALLTAGGESREDVVNLLKEAMSFSKEVSANDRVDFKRQRLQGEIRQAIAKAKAGEHNEALGILKQVTTTLAEMKSLI
jgi:hypothetical protein